MVTGRSRIAMILAISIALIPALELRAASLIDVHLCSVEEVALKILVPRYEAVPGISPDSLAEKLMAQVALILEKDGLRIDASSKQRLVVDVGYSDAGDSRAVTVLVELIEPAVLEREWRPEKEGPIEVTTWREFDLFLVSGAEADLVEKILESVELEATSFSQQVVQAKRYREREMSR
jgi:hypothetical protein